MTTPKETDALVADLLNHLGFSTFESHLGCRDHVASSVRVERNLDDECCHIYAFSPGRIGRMLHYEIRLPYAAPFHVIRATIEAALKR